MTFLYEILVRGYPDGSFAAHQKMATAFDDGFIRESTPEPLDPSKVAAVLGEAFPKLAAQLSVAQQALADKDRQIEALSSRLAAATAALQEKAATADPSIAQVNG